MELKRLSWYIGWSINDSDSELLEAKKLILTLNFNLIFQK